MAGSSKQTSNSRQRPLSAPSQVSTPPTSSSKSRKASKPSLFVCLRVPSSLLSQFEQASIPAEPTKEKKTSRPLLSNASSASVLVKAESDVSPSMQGSDEAKPTDTKTNRDDAHMQAGVKRSSEDSIKPKPAQRKRPKVGENGRMDGRTAAAKALGYNASAHKLGPKSNQGVINEKLRALDRSRKPCRKWTKAGFHVKSFTGRMWQAPSWRTPHTRMFGEEAESQETSSNEISKANSSSNIGSDPSPGGENLPPSSSPIRIAPAPTKR